MTAEQKVTRKLRAILSADVKGYSLLMTNNEAFTIKTLKEYRIIMSEKIKQHSGRVVDAPGDNLLAEFSSAVNAVECSVEIQNALKKRNADLPEDKRLVFRIGVNIGDVVQDGGSLYGEGVNIAARIEGLADPGGVCISRNAYDHIKNKLKLGYEYIGEHEVKNIKDPVRVYKVLMEPADAGKLIGEKPKSQAAKWIFSTIVVAAIAFALIGYQLFQKITAPEFEPASIEKMAYTLPVEPSIAVLPFENMSGDPKQDYFSDGITEQIITSLSNVPYLFVIARNSTFTYKNKPVKIQQVAEELGVQYVLEGSVQRSGDRIRITAQLIDAITGYHLWAENFDRKMVDIFQLQDEITMTIIAKLQVELSITELGRLSSIKTENLRAYEKYLKGIKHLYIRSIGDTLKARKLAEEAIEQDPEYGAAYRLLARTYLDEIYMHRVESRDEFLEKAEKLIQKSIELSGEDYKSHITLSSLYVLKKQSDKAIFEAQKAIELNPNSAYSYYIYGMILGLIGNYDQAILNLKKAIRLNPVTPIGYLNHLAFAHFYKKQYEKAIPLWEQTLKRNPDYYYAHMGLTAAYQLNGEEDKAKKAAAELIRVKPSFSVSVVEKRAHQKNKKSKALFLGALRKAGLPEYQPGKEIEKPSIAVLPFDNLSNDPDQEYFSDGMTDELICDLAKIENILVISRNSTFTYKGKPTKAQEIAKDLNVRYILEGSVQKVGNQVRIRVQLIDGKTDHHIWSESYDGVMDDIFELQDKITGKIVSALAIKLSADEETKLAEKGTHSIPAHDAYLKGMAHLRSGIPDDLVKAIQYFEKAVKLDPNYGQGYTALSEAYLFNLVGGIKFWKKTGKNRKESNIFRRHYIGLAMKNPVPKTFALFAMLEMKMRHYNEAVKYAQKAVIEAPNDADVLYSAGSALFWAGKLQEALKYLKKSNRLEPLNRSAAFMVCPYFSLKQYEKAVDSFEKSITNASDLLIILPFAAASYGYLGRKEEAKATLDKWIGNLGYRIGVNLIYGLYSFRYFEAFDHFMKGLKNAGRDGSITTTIKVNGKYKLAGPEIKALMFGKTEVPSGFYEELFHRKENGEVLYQVGDSVKKGISWIKNDMLCNKFEKFAKGCDDCADIYRNPTGENVFKNEYLKVTDYGLFPFSIKQEEN